jgi:parallel beta-helix repeat protein
VNQAVVKGCVDGLFFDDFPLRNIRVEGIEFICDGSGVVANGAFENVTLQNNIFQAGNSGIDIGGASSNWLITENVIEAVYPAIVITGAQKITLTNNQISGNTGITLRQCSESEVYKNVIQASDQGVLLAQESWKNLVQMNTILGVRRSGIALESDVTGNQILDNLISCAPGTSCVTIDVTPETEKMNTIRTITK